MSQHIIYVPVQNLKSYFLSLSFFTEVAPPRNITLLHQDESSLRLGWHVGAGDVTNFLVMCDRCSGEKKRVLDAKEEHIYTADYLEPGLLYTFSIQSFIVLGSREGITPPASDWVTFSVRTCKIELLNTSMCYVS